MRTIKFRAWDKEEEKMYKVDELLNLWSQDDCGGEISTIPHIEAINQNYRGEDKRIMVDEEGGNVLMQYTGLKDKNGLQEVYEGDIIDATGNIITNIHEKTHTEKSDFIIQGFGTKDWIATYQGAVARGCKDSE